LASSPTRLTGPPLGTTHLRLVASENTGPAFVVDVDTGKTSAVAGLGVPSRQSMWSPTLDPLMAIAGGALAVVTNQACQHCAITEDDYLIATNGSARRLATRSFPRLQGTRATARVPGSTAEWVLTWPHRGPCTLRLVPSDHAAVTVPCGNLGPILPSGIALWTHHDHQGIIVNPLTGSVRSHLNARYVYDPIGHGLAIESAQPPYASSLSLVNVTTGRRRTLGWPSSLDFGYRVIPAPHGPLVAIEFADPAYTPHATAGVEQTIGQAADIWLLDTRTATFTHVPGFPILELLKWSGVAWTTDNRLVIVAKGGGRTAIGVYTPGQRSLPVGTVPALDGYSQFVPLVKSQTPRANP
jgi:hypothetical protein